MFQAQGDGGPSVAEQGAPDWLPLPQELMPEEILRVLHGACTLIVLFIECMYIGVPCSGVYCVDPFASEMSFRRNLFCS